jgi:hypothetical protein
MITGLEREPTHGVGKRACLVIKLDGTLRSFRIVENMVRIAERPAVRCAV